MLYQPKARVINATSLSSYDCSIRHTTFPHSFIKDTLIELIKRTFQRDGLGHWLDMVYLPQGGIL